MLKSTSLKGFSVSLRVSLGNTHILLAICWFRVPKGFEWWAWVDLNHRPRPYQMGLLWCYMHSSVAMITLLTTSLMVTSWHDCWFQVARSVQSGDHFLQVGTDPHVAIWITSG
jgi:hypothetical protein